MVATAHIAVAWAVAIVTVATVTVATITTTCDLLLFSLGGAKVVDASIVQKVSGISQSEVSYPFRDPDPIWRHVKLGPG